MPYSNNYSSSRGSFDPVHQNKVHRSVLDLKADLYSILKTADILKCTFDQGRMDPATYFKNFQYFNREINRLDHEFQKYGENLRGILGKFPIGAELKPMISFISAISDYKYDSLAHNWQIDPFMLAKWSTESTSNFITILDYFHLINYIDLEFVASLIGNLENSLKQIALFKPFYAQISSLKQNILGELQHFQQNYNVSAEDVIKQVFKKYEDQFYHIFFEFKQTLSYSPSS